MPAIIITGMMCWSPEQDLFVVTGDGPIWLLDLPRELAPLADDLLHDRVIIEGDRIGSNSVCVRRIVPVPLP